MDEYEEIANWAIDVHSTYIPEVMIMAKHEVSSHNKPKKKKGKRGK